MEDYTIRVNQLVVQYLSLFIEDGPNQEIDFHYRNLVQNYPQIQNVVETYRHQDIRRIYAMQEQVWNELHHGNFIAFTIALDLCIMYMVENTMREASAVLNTAPPQPTEPDTPYAGPSQREPDAPSAGPTGGKFNTYRLRIR